MSFLDGCTCTWTSSRYEINRITLGDNCSVHTTVPELPEPRDDLERMHIAAAELRGRAEMVEALRELARMYGGSGYGLFAHNAAEYLADSLNTVTEEGTDAS